MTGTLNFKTDIFGIIQKKEGYLKLYLDNLRDFGTLDLLFFMITKQEGASTQDLIHAAESFTAELKEVTIDGQKALARLQVRTLEAHEYEGMKRILRLYFQNPELFLGQEDISILSRKLTDEGIRRWVHQNKSILVSQASIFLKELVTLDPLGLREFLMKHLRHEARGFRFDYRSGYFLSQDHRSLLIIADPIRPSTDLTFSRKLMRAIKPLLDFSPAVSIRCTGAYPITLEKAAGLRLDLQSSMVTAFILVLALFFFAYRRPITLLFVGFPLLVGVLITLAIAALLIGRLNILTTAFAAIVIGLGIDFAIHLYDRYHTERALGLDVQGAIEKSLSETGSGVLTGGVTSILAFCTLLLASVQGIIEFGGLVASGLFFCLVSIYFVLPSFLAWTDSRGKTRYQYRPLRDFGLKALSGFMTRYPHSFIIAFLLITGLFSVFALRIEFEGNLQSLGPKKMKAMEVYGHLERTFPRGNREAFIVLEDSDLNYLLRREEAVVERMREYHKKGQIISFFSLSTLIPSVEEQQRRRHLMYESIDFNMIREKLLHEMKSQGFKVGPFQQNLRWINRLANPEGDSPLMPETVLQELRSSPLKKLVERSLTQKKGRYKSILRIFYDQDRLNLVQFERDLKQIDPRAGVTGFDLINIDFFKTVKRDLVIITPLAFLLVVIFLYLHFRRWRMVILALVPLSVGITCMLGLMSIWGWKINFLNVLVIPIILGIGIDDGIHIIHRYIEDAKYDAELAVRYTGRAVIMTSLTTMVGFGSLVIAQYRALSSMGWIIILGIGFCLLTSIFLLPPLLVVFLKPRRVRDSVHRQSSDERSNK